MEDEVSKEKIDEVSVKGIDLEKKMKDLLVARDNALAEIITLKKKLLEKERDDAAQKWKRDVMSFLRRHRVQIGACLGIVGLALLARGEKVEGARPRLEEAGRDLIATMAIVSGVCGAITQFASYSSPV